MADDRYAHLVSVFDALIGYATEISSALAGKVPSAEHLGYADPIFAKLVCHAFSLRKLSPDPTRQQRREIWDISSSSAVARSLIEAYDALAYVAVEEMEPSEREFRLLLWQLHDQVRRSKILQHIGSNHPGTLDVQADAIALRRKVCSHQFYVKVSPGVKRKVESDDAPPFHLSQKERCVINGIDHDYYTAATMHLSQFVHTLPFSVHQLMQFRAGDQDSLVLMSLPIQYATAFLAKAIAGMQSLFPEHCPQASASVATEIDIHVDILARGLRNAG